MELIGLSEGLHVSDPFLPLGVIEDIEHWSPSLIAVLLSDPLQSLGGNSGF